MKRLLLKIIVVCLAPLPFLYGLQLIVDRGLRKSNHRFYAEWNDIYNGAINADLIVMGSSRAWRHISPTILDENLRLDTYNLAMNAWTFPMQKARFDIYLQHNKKPAYVVQSMDLQMLDRRADLFDYQQFLPYLDEPEIQKATSGYKGEFGWAQYYLPMFKYNGNLDLAALGVLNYFDLAKGARTTDKGFQSETASWDFALDRFRKQVPNGYRISFNPAVEEEFINYLENCRKNNIKVILVYSPVYVELNPLITNRQEILARFQRYSDEFGIPLLDYSEHYISYNRDYFYNSEHLNKDGAELFSKILARDLQSLGVR